ncbi:MAG: BatA domain-containing protein, partial [Planctomycetota bacterium]
MLAVLNPWLLSGLAAAGLPVLIHFLTRPRPRAIHLPTFHLLTDAGGGRQALDRLRTIVILTLRTLAVVTLALVFARPFIRHAAAPAPGEAPRVVLLVDA